MRLLLMAVIVAVCVVGNGYGDTNPDFHYLLKAQIDPSRHWLKAEVRITNPPSERFYLHKGLSIHAVSVDGKAVSFHQDDAPDPSMYARLGTPIIVEAKNARLLYVKYDGEIEDIPFECNMIAPELVELALYAAWYPLFAGLKEFTFDLEASLPVGFVAVANGMMKSKREQAGRSVNSWISSGPTFDMLLISSPLFHRVESKFGNTPAVMYYCQQPPEQMKSKLDSIVKVMKRFTEFYGPSRMKGTLQMVYSPRKGQGYSRVPIIVVSEKRTQEWMTQVDGEELDFRYNSHEIAHFWWSLANWDIPDDWINEGLAEYSAFRACEERFGPLYTEKRIAFFKENAAQSKTTCSIAETESSSPDREVNRYDKATLMFLEARERFGTALLDNFLKALYARFSETHDATTTFFLEEAEKQMGADAQTFFQEALFRKSDVKIPTK